MLVGLLGSVVSSMISFVMYGLNGGVKKSIDISYSWMILKRHTSLHGRRSNGQSYGFLASENSLAYEESERRYYRQDDRRGKGSRA